MFGNSFQNGFYFQVWDSRVNPQKNTIYKHLFKKSPSSLKNEFDKQVKSYIYQLPTQSKITLPADDQKQLSLHQRYLVIQINVPFGAQWSMQIGITDLNTQKKRINLTTTPGKQEIKYFSLRYPLEQSPIQKGCWSFLAIDIYSFCRAFKGTIFRSLDHILINGNCKLRRIFTMKEWLQWQIPKNYWLPSQIHQTLQMIEYRQPVHTNLINSSLNVNHSSTSVQNNYGKLAQSKVSQSPNNLQKIAKSNRNISQNYPGSLKLNKQKYLNQHQQSQNIFKLPEVPSLLSNTNKLKDSGIQKSSKLSSKIQEAISTQFGLLAKSNRSLTRGDLIVQKSKIRLNSLQQKQQEILTRMKSEQARFNEHQKIQSKKSRIKNSQLFQIQENKQKQNKKQGKHELKNYNNNHHHHQLEHNSSNNNIVNSHKIKIQKHFEQDQIYDQNNEYQSSSFQSSSYRRQNIDTPEHYFKNVPDEININKKRVQPKGISNIHGKQDKNIHGKQDKGNQQKMNNEKQRNEQIIQEDLWSDNQQERDKAETPIQQIIVGQRNQIKLKQAKVIKKQREIGKTVISKQNNKQIVIHSLQIIADPNNINGKQLQLIYDEMVGCYYHPSTNTYYQMTHS